jgi:hypothetical protein
MHPFWELSSSAPSNLQEWQATESFSVNHDSIRGLCQAGVGRRAELCYPNLDGLKVLRRMLRLELLWDPRVADPIGHHRRIPENAHFLQVTGSCRDW